MPFNWFRAYRILTSFPGGSDGTESACSVGDPSSIPGLGISPGEGNANCSSILAWKIPWMEEPGCLQPTCPKESDMTEQLHFHFKCLLIGSGLIAFSLKVTHESLHL